MNQSSHNTSNLSASEHCPIVTDLHDLPLKPVVMDDAPHAQSSPIVMNPPLQLLSPHLNDDDDDDEVSVINSSHGATSGDASPDGTSAVYMYPAYDTSTTADEPSTSTLDTSAGDNTNQNLVNTIVDKRLTLQYQNHHVLLNAIGLLDTTVNQVESRCDHMHDVTDNLTDLSMETDRQLTICFNRIETLEHQVADCHEVNARLTEAHKDACRKLTGYHTKIESLEAQMADHTARFKQQESLLRQLLHQLSDRR